MIAHPVWFVLSAACVLWYLVLLFYVGYRGAQDIDRLVRELKQEPEIHD